MSHITDAPFLCVSLVLLFSVSGGVTVSKRGSAKSCSAPFLCPDSSLCHCLSFSSFFIAKASLIFRLVVLFLLAITRGFQWMLCPSVCHGMRMPCNCGSLSMTSGMTCTGVALMLSCALLCRPPCLANVDFRTVRTTKCIYGSRRVFCWQVILCTSHEAPFQRRRFHDRPNS